MASRSAATEIFPIVAVPDLVATVAFYVEQFGFTMAYRWPETGELEFAYLSLGSTGLGLGRQDKHHSQTGAPFARGGIAPVDLCLYVHDLDAMLADLADAGTPIVSGPTPQPWGERTAYVLDPAGLQLFLIQAPAKPDATTE